ncbi:E3 ubiquitin-ligase UPL6 [Micractinium conductrix]|uniref:HECT-type E3 ubiquitin transferase n=1 Tax=Micractinium conductrix TaxID=554055 RepID=A0A2P6V0X2_9CHLO|nr:E3 ubiquitin-ligase UPL6 [Micractinium conductrix]|eukprot:PSC67747.1 E3 ubiquitin-ligase UPL6 [Micractinium conductrix]
MSGWMRSFGGEHRKEAKVSLAGRSRGEETRAEVLERTRRERERRRQDKLEQRSATVVQAAWRGWRCRFHAASNARDEWVARYGRHAERASSADLAPGAGLLRQLAWFANPADEGDVQLLAGACRVVLSARAPADTAAPAGMQLPLLLCQHAVGGGAAAAAVLQQAQALVTLCLAALAAHAGSLAPQLQQPRVGGAAAAASSGVAAPLVEAVLLLTASDSWKAALGPAGAAEATAQLLAAAVGGGLFGQLGAIAGAACPEGDASAPSAAGASLQAVPAGEALTTALAVRVLSQQAAVAARQQQQRQHALRRRAPPIDRQLPLLLCLPLLQRRLPTLRPVAARLWRAAVATLHALPPADLAAWLGAGRGPTGAALAAAALLGNLLEGGAAALRADDPGAAAAARLPALQFAALARTLLALLPQQAFFPRKSAGSSSGGGARWADEEEEEDEGRAVATAATSHVPQLPWDKEQPPSAGLASQLQLVSDAGLLRALVRAVLPAASSQPSGEPPGGAPSLRQRAADVRQLCGLLQQLMALPGHRQRLLVMLAFSAELVQRLWFSYLRPAQAAPGEGWVPSGDAACDPGWMLPLTLFSLAYSTCIVTAGDDELYESQRPLPLSELYNPRGGGVVLLLKGTLWHALWAEAAPSPGGWPPEAAALRAQLKQAAGKLMGQLHDRNCRRSFAPAEAFQADALPADRFVAEVAAAAAAGTALADGASAGGGAEGAPGGGGRAWGLLSYAPFLVPFRDRARLFQAVVAAQRAAQWDQQVSAALMADFGMQGSRFHTIRRNQVLQDAFDQLGSAGEALQGRVRIQFIDAHGLEEAGVDGGGLFKEFVEAVVREGFDPRLGLFQATTDNRLYPNPHAQLVMGNALRLIEFLGQVLGKAMYEGILVELPLAPFFLKQLRGAACDINDLPTLDPELYRNMVFLKRYEGDVAELGLSFTITDNVLGTTREVELAPRGSDTPVTAENRLAYIHRVADYRLNRQIRAPAAAFLRGLQTLIKPEWVRMFNEEELQMLISGGQQGLDLADVRAHVQYAGGYHQEHPVIAALWEALASFTPAQQAAFLRFITSCPRPPLLGFKYLEPPLGIQMAGSMLDERAADRLPTAATCMNLLKLPPYRSAQQVRDKLLYAIDSGAGFELS